MNEQPQQPEGANRDGLASLAIALLSAAMIAQVIYHITR